MSNVIPLILSIIKHPAEFDDKGNVIVTKNNGDVLILSLEIQQEMINLAPPMRIRNQPDKITPWIKTILEAK